LSDVLAYHEAGHALMALLLGGDVRRITIEPDSDELPDREGDTMVAWGLADSSEREFAAKAVQVSLAGPVAEMLYTGDPFHPGLVVEWAADWQEAWRAAARLHVHSRQRLEYLEQTSIRLYHLLDREDLWAALAALADNLLAYETLDRDQIEEIVGAWLQ
jgi:hypothetical protein